MIKVYLKQLTGTKTKQVQPSLNELFALEFYYYLDIETAETFLYFCQLGRLCSNTVLIDYLS